MANNVAVQDAINKCLKDIPEQSDPVDQMNKWKTEYEKLIQDYEKAVKQSDRSKDEDKAMTGTLKEPSQLSEESVEDKSDAKDTTDDPNETENDTQDAIKEEGEEGEETLEDPGEKAVDYANDEEVDQDNADLDGELQNPFTGYAIEDAEDGSDDNDLSSFTDPASD